MSSDPKNYFGFTFDEFTVFRTSDQGSFCTTQIEVTAGKLCPRDLPVVLN